MNIYQIENMLKSIFCNFNLCLASTKNENGIQINVIFDKVKNICGEFIFVDTRIFNKRGYERFEALCNRLSFATNDYKVTVSCDTSGYYYLTNEIKQSNYICITVHILDKDGNFSKFESDIVNFVLNIQEKYCKLLLNKNYLRRTIK